MKIMFVIDTMTKGGAERVVANLTSYLAKKYDITIITVYNTECAYELNENVKFYTLDESKTDIYHKTKKNMIGKAIKFIKRIKNLNQYKKEWQPNIIVSFLPLSNFITLFSNMFYKVKTIISVRNDPEREYNNKTYKFLMNWLYPKTDGIVFQTKEAKAYFKESIQKKSEIIPNPIHEDFIGKFYTGKREKVIVSVGRLEEQKNHKILIEAFNNILNKHPEYKLIIYGDGKLKDDLTNFAAELNLQEKVLLPGSSKNIKEKIYNAEMFVLPSLYEGMPNALMEAMALGMPVISTDCPCGGPRYLIKNNVNGILVPVDNSREIEKAINKIIEDREFAKKIGENAHNICDTLAPSKINKKWENYIKSIG